MGRLRAWLIRGLILTVLAGVAVGGWVAHEWVSPEKVRAALVAALRDQFPDVEVHVGSARLRLFGGIRATELRLTRPGDDAPFLDAPSAVIFHDKEQLARGQLAVRKVELDGPTIRVARQEDGSWSVTGLSKPGPSDRPVPTFVVRDATVLLTDQSPGGLPPIALLGAKFSLLNDPVFLLKVDAQFTAAPGATGPKALEGGLVIPVSISARLNRVSHGVLARVEVPDLAVGPDLAPALERLHPALGEYLAQFTARVDVSANLAFDPQAEEPLGYEVTLAVREGHWENGQLPWPIEHLAAEVTVKDGKVTVERGAGKLGPASIEFKLESRAPTGPAEPDSVLAAVEDRLERAEVTVRNLALDDDFFARLPDEAKPASEKIRRMFSPSGGADLTMRLTRTGRGWERLIEFRPNRLSVAYEKFRYAVSDLAGSVRHIATSEGTDEFRVQVTGTAGDRRVEISGRVGTEDPDPLIDLKIAGTDIPIDDRLFSALPPDYAEALGKLRATARADFTAQIRQPANCNRCENTFTVRVYDGSVNYLHFPYPVQKVRGTVVVSVVGITPGRPAGPGSADDTVQLSDFEGTHAGGRLWMPSGAIAPIPGTAHRRFTLRLQGSNCPIDADLRAAISALRMGDTWESFAPRGHLTFGADVEIIDRHRPDPAPLQVAATLPGEPPFDPATDLRMILNFKGPTVTPEFFPYSLDDLSGVLRYQGGKVDLAKVTAHHGSARFGLEAAEVRFGPGGEVWANVGDLSLAPLVVDADLLAALPDRLKAGVSELKLAGPMDLLVKHLVVKVPPEGQAQPPPTIASISRGQAPSLAPPPARPAPVVYWNTELKMAGASLDTGLAWTDVHGTVASVGVYDSTHLGAVLGNAWFDQATIARQPLTSAKLTFRVRPQEPDPLRPGTFSPSVVEFPDLTGTLYGGTLGGEARLILDEQTRYRVWLTASGVRLDELARANNFGTGAELRGLAQGKVLVESKPDPRTGALTLTGAGQLDVPNGRMYNLPVLLPLLKLLKLQAPDQSAFEEAHATFELLGDRVTVSQLDLIGDAVSLGGSGDLDTSGRDVRFEFYTIWSQALKKWLSTPYGDVTSFLSGSLFKIEMVRQANGEMDYRPHMLPVVTDPVRAVAERLRDRMGRPAAAPPATIPTGGAN